MATGNQLVSNYNPSGTCPLCCTFGGWDTIECTHCGALVKEKTETHIRGIFRQPKKNRNKKFVDSVETDVFEPLIKPNNLGIPKFY